VEIVAADLAVLGKSKNVSHFFSPLYYLSSEGLGFCGLSGACSRTVSLTSIMKENRSRFKVFRLPERSCDEEKRTEKRPRKGP
ncbi:MAG: hypothetical protein J6U30_04310, partial [Oscillospiraceae bacterium]|nr:hypothetical protein [Oscillospiraceae bacterium]